MAVDPRRRPLARARARRDARERRPRRRRRSAANRDPPGYDRSAKLGGSTEAGRRTSHCRPSAAARERRRNAERGRSFERQGAVKSRLRFCTTRTRAATLLRANPYPEVTDRFCRLPLPTLFYAARGCSPRRPAADIGTNRREDSAWPSPGFSRSAWGSRTPPQRAVLFALASLSPG